KSPAVLESAYNDKNGITAAFNLNLLEHINRQLNADFRVDQFAHQAIYNEEYGRIEMRLLSLCSQRVHIYSYSLDFIEGESILTEYSHKYSLADFARLAESAGFRVEQAWT